jgi:hypothetical protein
LRDVLHGCDDELDVADCIDLWPPSLALLDTIQMRDI